MLRILALTSTILLLAACGRGLPEGVEDHSEALTITGWNGLRHGASRVEVTGAAHDSVLVLLRRHSENTGVPLADYLVETDLEYRAPGERSNRPLLLFAHSSKDIELLRQAAGQQVQSIAAGVDSVVVLMPMSYHSLVIELSAGADSVVDVWQRR